MDKNLLLDLFLIPAKSKNEEAVRIFISSYLRKIGIPFKVDEVGNIYNISNKDMPILSAHMDTVQDDMDVLMSKFISIKDGMVKGYGVIGGDDKCGIYAILDLLKNGHTNINFLFSVQEEIGGIGSTHFMNKNDISNCLYGLVLDRRGNEDIICDKNEYGTKNFETVLTKIGASFGYKPNIGTFSDADFLSEQISCANLSVGYYNAHMKSEFVILSDLQNSINFTHSIIKNLDIKFDAPVKRFSYYGSSYWLGGTNVKSSYPRDIDDYLNGDLDDTYDHSMDEYVYPYDEECALCGSLKGTTYLKTLSSYLCEDCIQDLTFELYSLEDMTRTG